MTGLRDAILRGARATPRSGSGARSARLGDGFAFAQLRAYVDGDDPRRIDHAATARSGSLQTRVYVEETALVLAAIVDHSASMHVGRSRTLADAASDALHAWYDAAAHDDVVARIVDGRVVRNRRAAALISPTQPFVLVSALRIALHAIPRGASLLVVTDGFDAVDDMLMTRVGRRFDATILIANDPWRRELPLRGIVRVADSETGSVRRMFFGRAARSRYTAAAAARADELHAAYTAAGWRVGSFDETDGKMALLRTFGISA